MSGAVEFSFGVYISICFGLNASHMECVLLLANTPGWVVTNTIDICHIQSIHKNSNISLHPKLIRSKNSVEMQHSKEMHLDITF